MARAFTLKMLRGVAANIATRDDGEPYFATDTHALYVGYAGVNYLVGGPASFSLDTIGNTRGDILYRGASDWSALAPGTADTLLKSGGAGADPSWGGRGKLDAHYGVVTTSNSGSFDLSVSSRFVRTLDGTNGTLAYSNESVGQVFVVVLVQDGTGSRTVTWPAGTVWPAGAAPTLSTAAGATDTFIVLVKAAGVYYSYTLGLAMA